MICSVENIVENEQVEEGVFKLSVNGKYEAKPGQFYMLKTVNDEVFLPRPISVNDVEEDKITFLYALVGKGTKLMSKLKAGDQIQIMGPLGNGFDVEKISGKVGIISGGIGIAPLVYLTKILKGCHVDFYAGFKDVDYFVDNVEKNVNKFYLSTESGRKGHKGFITEIFNPQLYDLVICCGPKIMMKKVIEMCREKNTPILVSMENRMACGIGACLGCTCKTTEGNMRTCKEGPVFWGEDLILDE